MSFSPTKLSAKFKFEQAIAFYSSYYFSSQNGEYISNSEDKKVIAHDFFFNKFLNVWTSIALKVIFLKMRKTFLYNNLVSQLQLS